MLSFDPTGPLPTSRTVSSSIRRTALDTDAKLHRAREEQQMVRDEMANSIEHMRRLHLQFLERKIECNPSSRMDTGMISLLVQKIAQLEKRLSHMASRFSICGVQIGELPRQFMDLSSMFAQSDHCSDSDSDGTDGEYDDDSDNDDTGNVGNDDIE